MIEYQNNFLHTEIGDSGTFCMFTYIDNLGGVKKPRGVQRGAALCPFAVFSHSNVIYPLRDSAVHVAYSREPQSMRLYDRSSAIHTAYTAEIPQSMRAFGRGLRSPCGYYFPIQNLENISLTRSSPSDSPRIRPRLSYASVRSME